VGIFEAACFGKLKLYKEAHAVNIKMNGNAIN
jgi:hypothetical protein